MNKKSSLIVLQLFIVSLCFPIFYHFGKNLTPLLSFTFSLMSYWILILIASLVIIIFDVGTNKILKSYFKSPKYKSLLFLNFIPVLGVLFVVLIPNISNLDIKLISVVLVISLFNGILEEVFWRGIVLSKNSDSKILLILSTSLFTVFHFGFLLLPLKYHGGAINLVGGAAIMGFLWLFISKFTRNISFAIIAHILVNCFAFLGLFIDNNLI